MEVYSKNNYLPNWYENQKAVCRFVRMVFAASALALGNPDVSTAQTNGASYLNVSPVWTATPGIMEFSMPGTLQYGETKVTGSAANYTLTVNLKPGADVTRVVPYIKLSAGATIAPAVGQPVNMSKPTVFKVTLPTGEVQNWTVKTVHDKPVYTNDVFKAGDRVLFAGNSITHGGRYHQYIWLYYMTRFPNARLTILNAGIGGDIIANINNRFEEDILTKNPNIINLTFGMNDSGYFQYLMNDSAKVANKLVYQCDSAFKLVVAKLNKRPEIKKILMAGSPYDLNTKAVKENKFGPKPATFERIVQLQIEAAKINHWPFIDIYHPIDRLNKDNQKENPDFTLSGSNDRIHPESYGHLIWAYLYLRNQGLKGLEVANFTVDASNLKVLASKNCTINHVGNSKGLLSFDYLANALPFPIDEEKHNGDKQPASAALQYVPLMDDINQEVLRIKNLKGKNYELVIDGNAVGRFSATDFSKGINMAKITSTPQYQQAMKILRLNEERGSTERETRDYAVQVYNFARANGIKKDHDQASWAKMRDLKKTNGWINNDLYERGSNPKTQKEWQDKMERLTNEIYSSNKPVNHKIEIKKVD
ncbi:SGNH/GDSL hydrolase family protein [Mucilaginibacter sp. CSA2-8R]|uniref:SGNH/GDSL hydrolase family protein n=1 Tax=Mucilaginibacter sp. CSA2-8R TaxID=3141542 RepID=UPI00315CB805